MANKDDTLHDHNSVASEEEMSKYFTGTHEVLSCPEGQYESHLDRHKNSCKKSHAEYVSINQLTIDHFPSGYNDVYQLTKALADLTVRIAVKFTSLERPELVPGTEDPYPCSDTKGEDSLRIGTGRVWNAYKYTEGEDDYRTCPCPECDKSDTPRKEWSNIVVVTSRHVVYDLSEAKQTSCRLWFDEDSCPKVIIHGWGIGGTSVKEDWCDLYCVTHDLSVGEKLEEMVGQFDSLCCEVSEKYKSRRDVDKLTIIVSHPHGCSKQVSIGHWVHRQKVGTYGTRYTYTSCTCQAVAELEK
ncbi:uncharacterized protein LOC131943878 [Physella acuta]|uniref:uncharacterized protein LOC131943878 n=1 Tax=Physella acuta TaxID=109671 RepID=UPI0027DC8B52|nr:uncharacterized protein LOC131943878 [Physella acuta]